MFGVKQFCPMCRTELPPGPEKFLGEAVRLYFMIERRIGRGAASWGVLVAEDQKQMDEAVDMRMQAANQEHASAQFNPGIMYQQC